MDVQELAKYPENPALWNKPKEAQNTCFYSAFFKNKPLQHIRWNSRPSEYTDINSNDLNRATISSQGHSHLTMVPVVHSMSY